MSLVMSWTTIKASRLVVVNFFVEYIQDTRTVSHWIQMPAVGPLLCRCKLNITFTCRAFPAKGVELYQTCNHDRGSILTFSFLTFTFCDHANIETANIFGRDWKMPKNWRFFALSRTGTLTHRFARFPVWRWWSWCRSRCGSSRWIPAVSSLHVKESGHFALSKKNSLTRSFHSLSLSLTCQCVGNFSYDS